VPAPQQREDGPVKRPQRLAKNEGAQLVNVDNVFVVNIFVGSLSFGNLRQICPSFHQFNTHNLVRQN
jgi:hypothetical protein